VHLNHCPILFVLAYLLKKEAYSNYA